MDVIAEIENILSKNIAIRTGKFDGDIMSIPEFLNLVKAGYFTNYDGCGELVIDNKQILASATNICGSTVDIMIGIGNYRGWCSLNEIYDKYGDRVQIQWFNR